MSRPLQVYVDDADAKRLEVWCRRRGWTKSQALRVAVGALIRSEDEDPLLAMSGRVHGLPADASERFDRYVEESFVAEGRARHGSSGRTRGNGGRSRLRR